MAALKRGDVDMKAAVFIRLEDYFESLNELTLGHDASHYSARGRDAGGRIAYKGEPGPWGFKPQELEGAMGKLPDAISP